MASLQAAEIATTGGHTVDICTRTFAPVLRRVEWPAVAPVDLLAECPWIVHGTTAVATQTTVHDQEENDGGPEGHVDDCEDVGHVVDGRPHGGPHPNKSSSYMQPLRAPRGPRAPLSPAQRAAKKMLRLQEEVERQETFEARVRAARMPGPAGHHATTTTKKDTSSQKPVKQAFQSWRKRKVQQEQDQSPQRRLVDWMAHQRPQEDELVAYSIEMETRIHMTTTATLGAGLWKDSVASLIAAELTSESVFGGFVPTRRLGFHEARPPSPTKNTAPPVGGVPSFSSTAPGSSTSAPPLASSVVMVPHVDPPPRIPVVELYADEVREEAHALAVEGNVGDALATLQRGIDAVLHDFQDNQDEINAHGFNISTLAHAMATRVQLKYRARHRRRVACLVRLQQVWRRFHARSKFLRERKYRTASAEVIQRHYKKRFYVLKRQRCAMCIQRCFRDYKAQKLLVLLRRACRILNMQERRKREHRLRVRALQRKLWIKLKVILKVMWLIKMRSFSVTSMQKRWRGWKTRDTYASILSREEGRERARRDREDAMIEPRVQEALRAMKAFYECTAPGRKLVKWQKERPWLRWRRLRSDWSHVNLRDRAAALCGIYSAANGSTEKVVKRRLAIRTISRLLGGDATTRADERELRLSVEGLEALVESFKGQAVDDSESKTVLRIEQPAPGPLQRLRSTISEAKSRWTMMWKRFRQNTLPVLFDAYWRAALYPTLLVSSVLQTRRNRHAAVRELMKHQERVLRSALRHIYRVWEGESPKYICTWCGEGFGTTRTFFAHRKGATGCVEQEQTESRERQSVDADIEFSQNSSLWTKIKSRRKTKSRNDTRDQSTSSQDKTRSALDAWTSAFVLDDPPVHQLMKRRNRTALAHLLSVARCCEPPTGPSVVPNDVLALLLFALDARLHPLQRAQSITVCPDWVRVGSPPDRGSLHVAEVARALGVRAMSQQPWSWFSWRWRQSTAAARYYDAQSSPVHVLRWRASRRVLASM